MTSVIITAEIMGALIVLAVLGLVAAAHEWVKVDVSASVKFIPAKNRQPRNPVQVVNVVPGVVEPTAPVESITSARRGA